MKILGIDIGGSALKGAPVNTETGQLLAERFRIPTPEKLTPAQMGAGIADIAAHFKWRGSIGVGFPGVIERGRMLTSANLHRDFIGCAGQALFAKATGRPVALINDAAAAGLAEMRFGVGRGFQGTALLLTLGTGVGSVLFHRGQIFPCEFGHLPFKGRDAEKLVAASVRKAKDLSYGEWAGRLDEYLQLLERVLWPELIVIGGGISAKHAKFFKYLHPRAKLKAAQFLNGAGIVGAAVHAAEPHALRVGK
jgi:polyphosphate glucokinase